MQCSREGLPECEGANEPEGGGAEDDDGIRGRVELEMRELVYGDEQERKGLARRVSRGRTRCWSPEVGQPVYGRRNWSILPGLHWLWHPTESRASRARATSRARRDPARRRVRGRVSHVAATCGGRMKSLLWSPAGLRAHARHGPSVPLPLKASSSQQLARREPLKPLSQSRVSVSPHSLLLLSPLAILAPILAVLLDVLIPLSTA